MPELESTHPTDQDFQWANLVRKGWIAPLLGCFLLVFLFSSKRIGSYDLGTHLAAGRWIVQHRAFPGKDTFTYTQTDQDYLDMHGLYQAALFLIQKVLGYPGLTLLHSAVILLTFFILLWRLQLFRSSPGWACLFLLTSILLMERRFMVRPEVFSWLYLSLTLLILDLRERERNFLRFLPLLQLFWVNTEGLFMLGWVVMAAYAVSGRFHRKRWDKKLVQFSLLSVGADLLNPYFFKGISFPLVLLTRFQGDNPFNQTIAEFSSPWNYLKAQSVHYDSNLQIILFFLVSVLCLIFILGTLKKRKLHEILLPILFGGLAFSMVRNLPLFTLVSIPVLASCLADFRFPFRPDLALGKKIPWAMTFLILALALRVVTNAYYAGDRRLDRFGWGLDTNRLPVKAAEFLRQHHLDGRLLNNLGFGGWLDWKAPQPTFIDGRLEVMDQEFYNNYLLSFRGTGLSRLILTYQPQLILMEYNSAALWVGQLRQLEDWRLIYLDECTAIYSHGDYAKQIPTVSYPSLLSERHIPTETDEEVSADLEKYKPRPLSAWWGGFVRPQGYSMGLSGMGLFCLRAGEYQSALDFFMACLGQCGGNYEELYFNLGVSELHLRHFSLGKKFLQCVLELNPKDSSTLGMMNQLQGY